MVQFCLAEISASEIHLWKTCAVKSCRVKINSAKVPLSELSCGEVNVGQIWYCSSAPTPFIPNFNTSFQTLDMGLISHRCPRLESPHP